MAKMYNLKKNENEKKTIHNDMISLDDEAKYYKWSISIIKS